ncbi:MAG: stage III sporulation protein AF [Clostridia bacterium]|nr:stage III sporulation protein AF [Clostridia bacterium]
MIEFMSSWVKSLGLTIVIVSILEMLLPNNKTKKYIRVVMGVYVLFSLISPFISKKDSLNLNEIDFENYATRETSTTLNQSSMEERIKELYIQEMEKDISKKLKEMGYVTTTCKVKAKISDNEEETKINKIKIKVQKQEVKKEESIENQVVAQIQKVKPVNVKENQEDKTTDEKDTKVNKSDIQNIKKFLIEEYGVNEKCLEIN